MRLKFYLLLFQLSFWGVAIAQNDSVKPLRKDTPAAKAATVKQAPVRRDTARIKTATPASAATRRDSVKAVKKDSAAIADSLRIAAAKKDSLAKKALPPKLTWQTDTLFNRLFNLPGIPNGKPLYRIESFRQPHAQDELFYVLVGILFFLGFIRLFFPKYFINTFRLFFQTSFRQKQTREQLLQDRLPSLLMNIFFVLVGGVFISLSAMRNNWLQVTGFWWILLYCSGLLAAVYLVKYLVLQFTGWVFNAGEATDTYAFIVFLTNKMLGVFLLPLLLLYAFSGDDVNKVLITITACLVVIMLAYRYLVSLATVRGNLKVNGLHFFIYLCAVEIVPIIVIYKVLFNFVSRNI
ncbi:DUF4271 domain-containing protein [Foetidibacter luteolus]|uniref:DUF4271 domain-containing protein n=1 Tax=Foetidibacter luteolus TaxID=2608880 RepID=UPI00129C0E57|nr:DUF4271 domain-containing protein [Foetidibacter luteolus]